MATPISVSGGERRNERFLPLCVKWMRYGLPNRCGIDLVSYQHYEGNL